MLSVPHRQSPFPHTHMALARAASSSALGTAEAMIALNCLNCAGFGLKRLTEFREQASNITV